MSYIRADSYIGKELNGFKVLDIKRENKRTYLKVICPKCGNIKWMRTDYVKTFMSCGCEKDKNKFVSNDITGKNFGYLKVIRKTSEKNYKGSIIWECQCKCDNTVKVSASDLLQGRIKSCGCLKKETERNNGKNVGAYIKDNYCIENTNVNNLTMRTPKTNTSGVKGVSWDNKRQKWLAQIRFQGKNYYLGRYDDLSKAANSRKEAEDHIFGNFLKWYHEEYKNEAVKNLVSLESRSF